MRKDYRQTDEEWDRSRAQAQRSGGPGATVGRGSWVQAEDDTFSVERTGSPLVRPGYNKGEPLGDAGWNPSDIRSATAAAGLDPEDDVLALTPRMDLRPITAPGALPVAPGSSCPVSIAIVLFLLFHVVCGLWVCWVYACEWLQA